MKNRKKAFTLTELLVVVIVIGVLSAVVLPKFSKVVETRKTTEAEEIMAAVRTEQERRCALDKNYLTSMNDVKEIVGSSTSKNYQYSMEATGMLARSTGKYNYTLKMPSYRDGRICCENEEECNKLNKKYTPCSSLTKQPDYQVADSACAGEVEEVPTVLSCSGASTQTCGCNNAGTQTRTCNTTTGVWGDWSACSVAETCSCDAATKPADRDISCGCGTQHLSFTCDTGRQAWVATTSACVLPAGACQSGQRESRSCTKNGQTGTQMRECSSCSWGEWGECKVAAPECEHGVRADGTCKQPVYKWRPVSTGAVSIPACSKDLGKPDCTSGHCPNNTQLTFTLPTSLDSTCNSETGPGHAFCQAREATLKDYNGKQWWFCDYTIHECRHDWIAYYE